MKLTVNIPEKTVKQAMLVVTLKVNEATDFIEDVLATESVEIDDVIDACGDFCGEEELKTMMIAIAALGITQIIKNKVEENEK